MTNALSPVPLQLDSRAAEMFPTLTAAQIARLEGHGHKRRVESGEGVLEAGEKIAQFFVVTAGQIEVFWRTATGGERVAVEGPGAVSGGVSMLFGRRGLVTFLAIQAPEGVAICP